MSRAITVFAASLRDETHRLTSRTWDAFVAFGLPLILLAIIAAMLAPGVIRDAPVAVVDQDRSAYSRAAIRAMDASPSVRVVSVSSSPEDAMGLMRRGEVYSIAQFPPGLTRNAFRRPEAVSVSFNGAFQTVGALAALGQSAAIVDAAAPRLEARARDLGLPATSLQPPDIQVSIIGNPQLSFELFLGGLLGPGVLHLLAACSAVLAAGRLMRDDGVGRARTRTALRVAAALAGRLTPHFLVFSLWGLAWIGWLCGVRGWGVNGSLLMLTLGVVALMAVSVALSGFLVALLGDIDMAFSATALYSGAAIAFSNGTLPLDHGPRFARFWSESLPFTHYLRLQTGQMVVGAPPGAAVRDLAILVATTAGAFALGAILLRLRRRRVGPAKPLLFPLPPEGTGAVFQTTFVSLRRARPVASLLVLAVALYAFYYPAAYAGQRAAGLPVAVVSPAGTPLVRQLVESLNASEVVEVAAVLHSTAEADTMMRQGVVDGVIILPPALEPGLARGEGGGVAVWLNGGYLVRVTAVGRAVAQAVGHVTQTRLKGLPEVVPAAGLTPRLEQTSLFNRSEGYGDYAVPAVTLIILQQTLLLGAGVITATRRETQAPPLALSGRLGLWLALTAIGTASCLFYFGFVFWLQDYPRGGDLMGVVLLAPVFSGAVAALGLILGGLFDRHERVLQVLLGTSAPLFFLAGAAWPHFMMPEPLVWAAHLSPSTPAVQAFVRLNAMGASLAEVGAQVLLLAGLALLFGLTWLRPWSGSGHRASGGRQPDRALSL